MEQQKGKGQKKPDQLLVSKVEFIFRYPSEVKYLPFDPVFSSWVNIIKKCQSYVVLEIERAIRASIFYLKFES